MMSSFVPHVLQPPGGRKAEVAVELLGRGASFEVANAADQVPESLKDNVPESASSPYALPD